MIKRFVFFALLFLVFGAAYRHHPPCKYLSVIDEPVYDGMSNGVVSKYLVELPEGQVGG